MVNIELWKLRIPWFIVWEKPNNLIYSSSFSNSVSSVSKCHLLCCDILTLGFNFGMLKSRISEQASCKFNRIQNNMQKKTIYSNQKSAGKLDACRLTALAKCPVNILNKCDLIF